MDGLKNHTHVARTYVEVGPVTGKGILHREGKVAATRIGPAVTSPTSPSALGDSLVLEAKLARRVSAISSLGTNASFWFSGAKRPQVR